MTRTHAIEPELAAPTPRTVRYRDGWATGCGLWVVRLFLLPHTIIGIGALAAALWSTGVYVGVLAFGTDFQGQVVKKEERPGSKGKTYRYVHYEYMVDGRLHTGWVTVSGVDYEQVTAGDRFTVRALESAPDTDPWVGLPGQTPLSDLGGKWFFALFWNGVMSVAVWFIYVRPWQVRRLVRWGQPTEGIVRAATVSIHKGTKSYHVTCEYAAPADEDPLGPTVFTRKMTCTQKSAADVKLGNLVTVLYDPHRPKRSVIYRLTDYRAVEPPA
jgi:Protein of unknown function (DUF3592)